MENHRYQLNFADTVWTFDLPVEVTVDDNCKPFEVSTEQTDILFSYGYGDPDTTGEEKIQENDPIVWKGEGYCRVERLLVMSRVPCSCYYLKSGEPFHMNGLIYPGKEKLFETLDKILNVSDLEVPLASIDAISLHSALVRYQDRAILFSAPSGTGKSTQAELWKRYRGADPINGDRSIIRKQDGKWTAYGSPHAGTSGLFRNESVPIRIIVILRQSDKNNLRVLGQAEAFRYLYSETVVPRWNDEIHSHIMDIITQITAEVPVVMLSCRPEECAVDLLDQFLQEERNDR